MTIHNTRNISRSKIRQFIARSALDKNLSANANSRKPKVTFTALSQPPALPKEFNLLGKNAKMQREAKVQMKTLKILQLHQRYYL